MDVSQIAYDSLGLMVPVLALFGFSLPLLSKVFGEKKFPAVWATIAIAYSVFATSIIAYEVLRTGKPLIYGFGGWPPPIGISYEVDGLNAVLGLFTAWTMLFIVLYSMWYNKHFDEPEWYYILLIGLAAGMLGCLYTGDVFNLFVMLEVLGISAYALVAYHKRRPEAVEAAMKYAVIGAAATTVYFIGLVLIYGVYGTLNMGHIAMINNGLGLAVPNGLVVSAILAVSMSLWVFTYKSALFPNHFWLPDAHPEAPTPVSAALSGLVVNIGVYATIRFLYTLFGPDTILGVYRDIVLLILLILGFTGAVVGALLMMVQNDVKRLLAYSTVSHIGLIYMVASLGFSSIPRYVAALAITATVYHVLTHGVAKAMLFMASGVFIDAAGSRDLNELRGVGRKYPVLSLVFVTGFLSLMGIIPFGGFFSKLLMYRAFMEADLVVPALMIIVVSALSVPGYARAIYAVVFGIPRREHREVKLYGVNVLLLVMAAVLIALGILYPFIYDALSTSVGGSVTPAGIRDYWTTFLIYMEKLSGGMI